MNKLLFFTGLSFFILELFALLVYGLSQIQIAEDTLRTIVFIVLFGGFNLVFVLMMFIGALQDQK